MNAAFRVAVPTSSGASEDQATYRAVMKATQKITTLIAMAGIVTGLAACGDDNRDPEGSASGGVGGSGTIVVEATSWGKGTAYDPVTDELPVVVGEPYQISGTTLKVVDARDGRVTFNLEGYFRIDNSRVEDPDITLTEHETITFQTDSYDVGVDYEIVYEPAE